MWQTIWPYVAALTPFLFMGAVFFVIMRAVVTSDRNERAAQRLWREEHATEDSGTPGRDDH